MMEVLLRRRSSEACRAIATGETSLERPRGCMSRREGRRRGDVRRGEVSTLISKSEDRGLLSITVSRQMTQYEEHSPCSSTSAFCLPRSNPRSERARTGNVLPATKEHRTRTRDKREGDEHAYTSVFRVIYLFMDILSLIH
jgi:hypothetical protein